MAEQEYDINLDIKYEQLEHMDIGAMADATKPWFNQTLTRVNESVVRLGVLEGDFHWHKHDNEDEFFYVVEGRLLIDLEGGKTVELLPRQGLTVPHGVLHRPRATERTVVLMVEPHTVAPTGDA